MRSMIVDQLRLPILLAPLAGGPSTPRLVAAATDEQAKSVTGIVQANAQIRRTMQEVRKAMAEQGRAARDILKAAQSTKDQAGQIRNATAEQVKTGAQITQAADSMRRCHAVCAARDQLIGDPTARALTDS